MLRMPRMFCRSEFRSARAIFEAAGFEIYVPLFRLTGNIRKRARQLARYLRDIDGPLHLIGHSMGGLVARHYIAHEGGYEKVASLTTLATPHLGSSAASGVLAGASPFAFLPPLRELTPLAVARFNEHTPDHPSVTYRSYCASRPLHELPWLFRKYGRWIWECEHHNDGQVSCMSAQWGVCAGHLHADHFELIDVNLWLNPFRRRQRFDSQALYHELATWIAACSGRQVDTRPVTPPSIRTGGQVCSPPEAVK